MAGLTIDQLGFHFAEPYMRVQPYARPDHVDAVSTMPPFDDQGFRQHPKVAEWRRRLGEHDGVPKDVSWAMCRVKLGFDPDAAALPAAVPLLAERPALCLFNIVVALEWVPSPQYLAMLTNAFTAAAKLLFDVTDGYMTIGQVVIGTGPDWMDVADFQVLASNRLLPRTQVGGLLDGAKFQPIRMGRGLWSKSEHRVSNWAESRGVLVHEWGHYALGLRDQYLESMTLPVGEEQVEFVVPALGLLSASIMAGDQQTEITGSPTPKLAANLQPQLRGNQRPGRLGMPSKVLQVGDSAHSPITEWEQLARQTAYGFLEIDLQHTPQETPPPITPIPEFLVANSAKGIEGAPILDVSALNLSPETLRHCWVYLKKSERAGGALVQQGVFGAEANARLELLGGAEDDVVSLFFADSNQQGRVLRSILPKIPDDRIVHVEERPTAVAWPMVAVTYWGPDSQEPGGTAPLGNPVWLRVDTIPDLGTDRITLSPATDRGRTGFDQGDLFQTTELDGVVSVNTGADANDLNTAVIGHFAQGGSPDGGYPAHPNPIPSGSGEGNAMIFFHDDALLLPEGVSQLEDDEAAAAVATAAAASDLASKFRIITTTNYHVRAKDGDELRSYVFGVATNRSLMEVENLHPTLLLAYDTPTKLTLKLYRYDQGTGEWTSLKGSSTFNDRLFVAAPLSAETAPGLFNNPPTPEFFRLLGR